MVNPGSIIPDMFATTPEVYHGSSVPKMGKSGSYLEIALKVRLVFQSEIYIGYIRGDSMNGTPTASLQRLCAIERV